MPAQRTCPRCGSTLSSYALEGLCPTCVGRVAFCSDEPARSTPEIEAEFARLKPEEIGEWIGAYRLMDQIGQGGFGTVWVADQERPVRRRVALKIVKLGMDTKEVISRFEQERQALALMDHPNIAKVFDAGATRWGRPFFVMELVHGIKITDYCDQANLSTAERLELFIQVCHAVQHAHQKGIIHRDIKPSNILVTINDGVAVPKVIDFGIAKATAGRLTDATVYTQLNQFIGTPAYMSPEQAELASLDIDTRSDLYSLGVLLYELLVGKTPFDQETLMRAGLDEMRRVIREQEPQKPSTAWQTMAADVRASAAQRRQGDGAKMVGLLAGDLDWIVMKALEKDRSRRYETANGFAQDIRRFLADEPVSAAAPSAAYLFRKFARRNKGAIAVAALIIAVLVAATAISLWQAKVARKATADAMDAKIDATAKAAAERVAREESEAIMKFFVGVFQSPDPARNGRTITVAESLRTAVKKLQTELADQPAQRAKLQYTIGLTFHSLDLAPEAIPLLEAALVYYRAALGAEHPTTLMVMGELGFSFTRAGRQGEALKLQEERVMLSRRIYSMRDPDMVTALASLANCYADVGRKNEALKLQEEVLSLIRTIHGPEHPDTLKLMSNLAVSYSEAGREDEALKMRDEMLTVSRKVNGAEHPDTLVAMGNLALSYDKKGRREDALALQEDVIRLTLKVNGPKHTETLTAMTNLAISYGRSGNLDKALKMLEEVLQLRVEGSGPDHPETLMAMTELAVSYGKGDRMPEAIAMQEKALATMRQVLPPKHPYLLGAMQIMSALYFKDGRREEAHKLRLEREALEGKVEPAPSEQSGAPTKVPANSVVPGALVKQEVKPLEDALESIRKTSGPETPETIAAMSRLAGAYGADGSGRKAIQLGEEALTLAQRVFPTGDRRIIDVMKVLIPIYKAVDLDDKARELEAKIQSFPAEKQK